MKLNGIKPSGYKGKWGWRNLFDIFIRERTQRKVRKAVQVINKNSSVPVDRSLILYQPAVRFRTVDIPVPIVTVKTFAFVAVLLIIVCIVITAGGFIYFVNSRLAYEERVRSEVLYDIRRMLEPYMAQQEELKVKVSELDNYMVANPITRGKMIKKFQNLQTGSTVEKEVWR